MDTNAKVEEATQALGRYSSGDTAAAGELMPLVYNELRQLAHHYMQKEGGYNTLQATALVNEAYMRLIKVNRIDWNGKTHFYAMAATEMRRVLIEHARAANAKKRGADGVKLTLDDIQVATPNQSLDLLDLDLALERLAKRSARQAKIAELRLFAALNHAETALIVGCSERTVRTEWRMARAWIARELDPARDSEFDE